MFVSRVVNDWTGIVVKDGRKQDFLPRVHLCTRTYCGPSSPIQSTSQCGLIDSKRVIRRVVHHKWINQLSLHTSHADAPVICGGRSHWMAEWASPKLHRKEAEKSCQFSPSWGRWNHSVLMTPCLQDTKCWRNSAGQAAFMRWKGIVNVLDRFG